MCEISDLWQNALGPVTNSRVKLILTKVDHELQQSIRKSGIGHLTHIQNDKHNLQMNRKHTSNEIDQFSLQIYLQSQRTSLRQVDC